ncbi:MAG: peptidyl-dipeptidase Dcp [Candidatus Tokpelaia sp. JSC085]|nr:MAG: peptidyl-dipeptidase Dcp [Candidatus Tokpelaia sp. JSC085]
MSKTDHNPFVEWNGALGLPDFSILRDDGFAPAFDAALQAAEEEIEALATLQDAPTIENFLVPFELSGKDLDRISAVFFVRAGVHSNEPIQNLERDLAPKLSRFYSRLLMDSRLFYKIDTLYQQRETCKFDSETCRVIEETWKKFVRNGARLGIKGKERLAEINERLAVLMTLFNHNVLKDDNNWVLYLETEEELAGLPHDLRNAMSQAARERGREKACAVILTRAIIIPFLTFSDRRDLREAAMEAWTGRGANGGAADNSLIITEIARLRDEKAKLLGFSSYAAFKLDSSMAKTSDMVMDLLLPVWEKAKKKAKIEQDALQRLAAESGHDKTFTAWDWHYYAEKLKSRQYAFDQAELKPYLQLEHMIQAAFWVAKKLFGLIFEEKKMPLWHADARLWLVKNADGSVLGIFIGDYFARASKQSGAWMSALQSQHKLGWKGAKPIVYNINNFARSSQAVPTLLTLDDAYTLFHEFGHALHGLLSDVTWPSVSGTSVTRDFVELPSQLYENWLTVPKVMEKFARHYKTGQAMPKKLLKKIIEAKSFNSGFETVQYISSALIDIAVHSGRLFNDPAQFEKAELKRLGMPDTITMMHRLSHFKHVFSGDDYSAGYYSYLWSEVLDVDAFAAFTESGDVFNPQLAVKLKECIYSTGGSADPVKLYKAFRGHVPSADAIIRERGLE